VPEVIAVGAPPPPDQARQGGGVPGEERLAARESLVERLRALHLLEAGVPAADVSVVTLARARYVVQVVAVHGTPCLVLKEARDPDVLPLLAHEAAVLRWLATTTAGSAAPRIRYFDDVGGLLVTSHVSRPTASWTDEDGRAANAGPALARLHGARSAVEAVPLPASPVAPLLLPTLAAAADRHAGTRAALHYLARHWVRGAVVHGDVKWEHFHGADGQVLIDWELGGAGDPAWDVAGLLHELCAMDMPWSALGACLRGYVQTVGRPVSTAFFLRCAAALTVRFVQSEGEYASMGHGAALADRSWRQAQWWADRPGLLERLHREAA
jgi:hypothetical protein